MKNLCQLDGMSCFGCCGSRYKSIEEIKKDIKQNTKEYDEIQDKMKFKHRARKWDLAPSGVCRNAIEKEGKIFCPLHPMQNKGKDLRVGHCDTKYLCKTFKLFITWYQEKQDAFVDFVKSKKLDNYHYSILMDSDKLLDEFMASQSTTD